MKRIINLLLIIILILPALLMAQKNNYRVQNLSLDVSDNQLYVNYDLIGKKSGEPVMVHLFFYDSQYRIYYPKALGPETKQLVKPGLNHSIVWDYSKEMKKIDVELHPYLIPGKVSSHNFGMGSEAALLSLAIPGLGNYFVTDTRTQLIKPWMKTISSFGLIALGSIAANERYRDDPKLLPNTGNPYEMGKWNYKYFNSDAEFLISAGIVIWLADVVFVAIKGNHNHKLKRNILGMSVVYN
jgi:hypothetical protein